MKSSEFEKSLSTYTDVFAEFCQTNQISAELFSNPDHLAIKCANEEDYFDTLDTFRGIVSAETEWVHWESGRRLFSAELTSNISVSFFNFRMIEIMQPKPGKETDYGFVEHLEFYNSDIYNTLGRLSVLGLPNTPKIQLNDSHKWVNIVMDSQGREIKFNDLSLKEVVVNEKNESLATDIVYLDDRRNDGN